VKVSLYDTLTCIFRVHSNGAFMFDGLSLIIDVEHYQDKQG